MSIKNFIHNQRKRLVGLIHESITHGYQRYLQVLKCAEELMQQNESHPEDNSINKQLSNLRTLVQFTNSDTSHQIDLVLQQSTQFDEKGEYKQAIMKKIVVSNQNQSKPPLQSQTQPSNPNAPTYEILSDSEEEQKIKEKLIISQSVTENQKQSTQQLEIPTSINISRKVVPTVKPGSQKAAKSVSQKPAQEEEKKQPARQYANTGSISNSETLYSVRLDATTPRNQNIFSKSTFTVTSKDEEEFKKYFKSILELEERSKVIVTPKFKDREFFFLRRQNSRLPILSILDRDDQEMFLKLQPYFNTQRQTAEFFFIQRRLVCKSIQLYRQENQRLSLSKEDDVQDDNKNDQERQMEMEGEKDQDDDSFGEGKNVKQELQRITSIWTQNVIEEPFEIEGGCINQSISSN